MRQCPNCKTNNPDDARFCNYCGMRLPESKEETLYSELNGLEETPKVDFSDKDIEKISEELEESKEPEESQKPEKPKKADLRDTSETSKEYLEKQFTIPENLGEKIEKVTKEELEQELHKKIKLREKDIAEKKEAADNIDEPTRMIGSRQTDEADEPTRMFTGDIGDFIKKKKDYEEVPEEDAYEEILQSWERKRKEKQIKREKEGKDPSRIPKFFREKHSWSDLTEKQKKMAKKIALGVMVFAVLCGIEVYRSRPEAVIKRYCKAYAQENWKKTGRMADIPDDGLATLDEYVEYMKKHAISGVSTYQMKETKENRQMKVESGGKRRAYTVTYKKGKKTAGKETVILEKQKHRKLLLFANWKVSTDQMIARDYNLYVPAGGQTWVDGIELTKEDKVKDEDDNLDQYKVSLFEGEHKIKVKVPWFQTYESVFQASDKGSMTAAKMKISQNGKKKLDKKMKQTLQKYIEAAKAGEPFAKVSGVLEKEASKDSSYVKENKEFYNDLKEALKSAGGYTTEDVKLDQYEGKYVINGVTGVVRGKLSYHYTVSYSKNGDGTEGTEQVSQTADGSTTMSAEFVYKNGDYQLLTVDPGSVWYRE